MNEFLDVAREAAREAGRIQRAAFRTPRHVESKGPDDVVTDVDRRAEAAITDCIREAFPDHGILAEESGEHDGSRYRWIVDPLDGTTNFVQGIAHYCVSVALAVDDRLELGVVYHTPSDDCYAAVRDDGALLNGDPLSVSTVEQVDRAVVAVEFSPADLVDGDVLDVLTALNRTARRTRHMGSSASELALLARGTFDGLFGTLFQPWDVAAGRVIVEEAGGTVTHLAGADAGAADAGGGDAGGGDAGGGDAGGGDAGGGDVAGRYLVSNGEIHDALLTCVQDA